jgi:hypothetical protein
MHLSLRAVLLAILVGTGVAACNGRSGLLGPAYEYEEDLTLSLDGSARLIVNASVPALVVLRGLPLNTDRSARLDHLQDEVRKSYSSANTKVDRISTWTRGGRRFVGIHLAVADVRALSTLAALSWVSYDLHRSGDLITLREVLSTHDAKPGILSGAGLTGNELLAFRLHLPSRVRFHNSRYLDTNEPRSPTRGNILTWEQRLSDRLDGKPIAWSGDHTPNVIEVQMDAQSILYRTLWLFALAFGCALAVIAALIWLTIRHGSRAETQTL